MQAEGGRKIDIIVNKSKPLGDLVGGKAKIRPENLLRRNEIEFVCSLSLSSSGERCSSELRLCRNFAQRAASNLGFKIVRLPASQ